LKISGSIAVVTGGAKGLGLAIATLLQTEGAKVAVFDRDRDALQTLPAGLAGAWVDVTRPEEARSAVEGLVKQHGRIDVLVNNAGVIFSEPLVNFSNPAGIMHDYERFRGSLLLNLDSVFIMTSAAVEEMVMRRTKGVVINISSISSCGNEGQTAYSAAKAAVNAMTVTWAKELGRWGIRCNAVAPGFIDTESTRKAMSEGALDHVKSNTPLRRLGRPDEVAQAVVSLIENQFINGAVLNVDGGLRF
jgi:3-oxoacyl-[acyl-carrier protein] reductase